MLVRQYGENIQSVEPDFDARAMTEIKFRKTDELRVSRDEFTSQYERVGEHLVSGNTDAPVQKDAEELLLAQLLEQIQQVRATLGEGEVLLFENEMGNDYPKLREQQKGVLIDNENRIHFYWHVDPPIRLGHFRRK